LIASCIVAAHVGCELRLQEATRRCAARRLASFGLWPQPGARRDDRRAAVVHSVDDLARVDPLQIHARDAEMGMPELALDDRQRDPSWAISIACACRS
jgi:hypothetical protein